MRTFQCNSIIERIPPALWLCLALVSPSVAQDFGVSQSKPMRIDTTAGEVRLFARFQPKKFSGRFKWTPNYHFAVWEKGKSAGEALFVTFVSDREVHKALMQLGAQPGNNLTTKAWDERNNPRSPEPDTRIEGTPVQVLFWWEGMPAPLPVDSLLEDPGGRGFDLRFGGNLALIPEWRSGCVVCLYSCPGSKVGNHSYTIRDYVKGTTRFELRPAYRKLKKRDAVLIFRVKKEGK